MVVVLDCGKHILQRLQIAEGVAAALGGSATVEINTGYPVTKNHGEQTGIAVAAASDVAGAGNVNGEYVQRVVKTEILAVLPLTLSSLESLVQRVVVSHDAGR